MTMFGLFLNSYDYHEWHDLIAVSASEGDLVAHVEGFDTPYILLDGDEQDQAKDREFPHYVIEPVTLV